MEIINYSASLHSYLNIEKFIFILSTILYVLLFIACIEIMPSEPCRDLDSHSLNKKITKKDGTILEKWTFQDIIDWNMAQIKNEYFVVKCYECDLKDIDLYRLERNYNRHCRDKHGAKGGDILQILKLDLVNEEWLCYDKELKETSSQSKKVKNKKKKKKKNIDKNQSKLNFKPLKDKNKNKQKEKVVEVEKKEEEDEHYDVMEDYNDYERNHNVLHRRNPSKEEMDPDSDENEVVGIGADAEVDAVCDAFDAELVILSQNIEQNQNEHQKESLLIYPEKDEDDEIESEEDLSQKHWVTSPAKLRYKYNKDGLELNYNDEGHVTLKCHHCQCNLVNHRYYDWSKRSNRVYLIRICSEHFEMNGNDHFFNMRMKKSLNRKYRSFKIYELMVQETIDMIRKYEGYQQWTQRMLRLYKLHKDVGNMYHTDKDPIKFIDILYDIVK